MATIVDVRGVPGALRALDRYDGKELQNRLRRGARAGAAQFRDELRAEAKARSDLPRSFSRTKTKTTTRGGRSGRDIQVSVRPKSPLFNIFEPGAGQHTIPAGAAGLGGPAGESGWTSEGRKRPADFFSRSAVSHPGMEARPLLPAVFARRVGRAEDAIAEAIFGTTSSAPIGAGE